MTLLKFDFKVRRRIHEEFSTHQAEGDSLKKIGKTRLLAQVPGVARDILETLGKNFELKKKLSQFYPSSSVLS